MTIDERLEKLTERHEALTQTVELIAVMQRDLTRDVQGLTGDVQRLQTLAKQDGENIRALVRIAEIHERRLTELEGGE